MSEATSLITNAPAAVRPDARPAPMDAPPRDAQPVVAKAASPDEAAINAGLKDTKLTVSLDAETGTFIYRSVSPVDGEVVWQWPSEQVMRVIQYFRRIESMDERAGPARSVDQKA